jgi:hypothetical protein
VIGGLASAVYGRARWTQDIDYCKADATEILDLLGQVLHERRPALIYKAFRETTSRST